MPPSTGPTRPDPAPARQLDPHLDPRLGPAGAGGADGTELHRLWTALTGLPGPAPVRIVGTAPDLPTCYRVADAAVAAVGLALAAAARLAAPDERPDGEPARTGTEPVEPALMDRRAAVEAFAAERRLRVDAAALPVWDPLAGDYRSADGWVKLHTNYAHHRRAALAALGLPPDADRDAVAAAVAVRPGIEIEDAVQAAGGAAAVLRSPAQWRAHPQSRALAARPLLELTRLDGAPTRTAGGGAEASDGPPSAGGDAPGEPAGSGGGTSARTAGSGGDVPAADRGSGAATAGPSTAPLAAIRVVDLTRVIAGPTATKVLAALGADVLRLDDPAFAEVPALVPDTTAGKRCARLDLRDPAGRARFLDLLADADVLVCGLRPGALARLGLPAQDLLAVRPGLVLAELSAYGDTGPWAGRRGFDSLVQFVTGIAAPAPAHGAGAPVPLPVQALDHASGWLLAAGVLEALYRRRTTGGAWRVGVQLARTAAWLDGLGRVAPGAPADDDVPAGLLEEVASPFGLVRRVRFPGSLAGRPLSWAGPPSPLGAHPASWP